MARSATELPPFVTGGVKPGAGARAPGAAVRAERSAWPRPRPGRGHRTSRSPHLFGPCS